MPAQQNLRAAAIRRTADLERAVGKPDLDGRVKYSSGIFDANPYLGKFAARWTHAARDAARQQPPETAIEPCAVCGVK